MEHRYPEGFEDEHAEGVAAYATRQATLHTDIATAFERLWAPLCDLEVVEELEPARATPNPARATPNPASDDDIDEHDVDDGNDGIDGEDGGEEEQNTEEEEEGSTGEVSGEEEEEDL